MLAELTISAVQTAAEGILKELARSAASDIAATINDALRERKTWTIGNRLRNLQFVRTLFSSYKNVRIEDFYYRTIVADSEGATSTIDSLDQLVPGTCYVLSGTAGQGKSILMRRLCLEQARFMSDGRLPIFIALGEIDGLKKSLKSVVIDRFREMGIIDHRVRVRGYARADSVVDYVFTSGKAALLLDGFDELNSEQQPDLVRELEQWRQLYPALQIVVSSRPDTSICHSSAFSILELQNLTTRDLRPFLQKLIKSTSTVDSIVEGVLAEAPEVRSVLATPLMVTLLAIVYLTVRKVPPRLVEFYGHVFDVLLYRHDVTKGSGFKRERFSRFAESELSEVFRAICFVARSRQLTAFRRDEWRQIVVEALALIQDWNAPHRRLADERRRVRGLPEVAALDARREVDSLRQEATKNLCLLVEDGPNLTFIHKTIAEYLSAEFIQRADEDFAVAFYETLTSNMGNNFLPELQFLAEIDARRYVRLFWLPQFTAFCSSKRVVIKKGRNDEGQLEISPETDRLLLNDVMLGFWLDRQAQFPDVLKISDEPAQLILPSAFRCFDATLDELWTVLADTILQALKRDHFLTVKKLLDAEESVKSRANTLAAHAGITLDPTLSWYCGRDLLDLGSAQIENRATSQFVAELTRRWRGFRSVARSEQRRRDFLVSLQKKIERKG